ncbi:MAG: ribosomal protein L18 [Candidatus Uhrbacteria bacterium GW2011_GWD2_41_121]|uniref:Large ribosomal subunit protein uL18 n=1 Tax=Candidatus Uhrbacteria bacterium GW2011_GWC1_41_20 TaxID=1618983 RepID=A0A0G0XR16_9BACT|nr:MAG: ribosomal protein L18 [Candidatus Uhrbacteria bacterium GW2011_GWE1_39_46]KKR64086.1 MAG: ribosomal protein L18 [Candidatus Uhrbacteria bacterium GW2011_GWC2_40_450]KKR90011.1 MAG: ribosomal protein L18 [Candidatus Uhrbacteria bacterium GW2011_GWD2_41_121]KKR90644.1 MAG: ribosomal protein L18 [Candidatus Uhrbacteria bacterium GW2011_GWE2_41_1153]KKR95921.1 MAG: ribosomal protein L18 [Candidatus Uhrbacteria bacterium GW2011_GWD1_41_16]KKR99345.1 MAG: ribosomal protein L18 [Candidatus Uh
MKETTKYKRSHIVRRAHRTRSRIRGTQERPRLTVFRSSKHITAQVINDEVGVVLAQAADLHVDATGKKPVEIAALVGAEVAKRAMEAGVTKVVFDRGAYLYHGRVKALADSAREKGLEF